MSTLRDSDRLAHIVAAAERIVSYLNGVSFDHFCLTPILQDAVLRQLMIVGEAASRLTIEQKRLTPEVPWSAIIGFRHRIVHDYLGMDLELVWLVATAHLPSLTARIKPSLPASDLTE